MIYSLYKNGDRLALNEKQFYKLLKFMSPNFEDSIKKLKTYGHVSIGIYNFKITNLNLYKT